MTKIYYQGEPWAYMHQSSIEIEKYLNVDVEEIIGYDSFEKCWNELEWKWNEDKILVLAIENTTAGVLYDNLYKFLQMDVKIIWEYDMEIEHCICSLETDISKVKKVYSHFKALPQCYEYLKEKGINEQIIHSDTAGSAKMIAEEKIKWSAAICATLAANMYWLNILDKNIQDQKWNTTRFAVIVSSKSKINYINKKNKISILFEAKNIPASLYKCLGAFATNNVNLTKIESLPNIKNPFSYLFWLDFDWSLNNTNVIKALEELEFFTSNIKIIWEY